MAIKKQFSELLELLEANKSKKVSTLMPEILRLVMSNKMDTTVLKNDKDEVIAIYCYYHKQWELLSQVEYGKKASRPSGFNTMCKVGVSKWTKQQSVAKKQKEAVLDDVSSGKIEATDIRVHLQAIEDARKLIDVETMPIGYQSIEDALNASKTES